MISQSKWHPGQSHGASEQFFLGVDGGGTKTHALLLDQSKIVIGEGFAGPANPLRVGVSAAATAVELAVSSACAAAQIETASITAARIGIAGVREAEVRRRMRAALAHLGLGDVLILADSRIALYGAAGGRPAVVIIAGTGSICCGINNLGKRACAGGWGPVAGDEGSGVWIARRALQLVAQATDGRGVQTMLIEAAYKYFQTTTPDELLAAIYAPGMTHDRIAGFGREVIATAQQNDVIAREIISTAGYDLGQMAASVIRRLGMQRDRFPLAYVGGVFAAGEILTGPLRSVVGRVAPEATLERPQFPPAMAAALMAREGRQPLALAG